MFNFLKDYPKYDGPGQPVDGSILKPAWIRQKKQTDTAIFPLSHVLLSLCMVAQKDNPLAGPSWNLLGYVKDNITVKDNIKT